MPLHSSSTRIPTFRLTTKVPELHRYILGGAIGGPIIKDKLFGFLSYQHLHVSDQEIGDSFLDVPVGLSDDRSANALANLSNNSFGANVGNSPITAANIDRDALVLFNSPALPGEPGKWLIPNDSLKGTPPSASHLDNAFLPGTGRFTADLAVADLDYNATKKDTLSLKYFYQHDPTLAPYGYSSVPGFTEHLDSGAQVASITNTLVLKSNLSTTQTLGVLREKDWGDNEQAFGPGAIPGGAAGTGSINMFGSKYFPGISIYNVLGQYQPSGVSPVYLNIGPNAEGQSANTGMFQNRLAPSGNANLDPGQTHRQLRRQLHLHATQHHRQAHRHRHHCQRRLQPVCAGLCVARQFGDRLLCHLISAGQCQPLLPRQPAWHLRAGQVADHADPIAHRRPSL